MVTYMVSFCMGNHGPSGQKLNQEWKNTVVLHSHSWKHQTFVINHCVIRLLYKPSFFVLTSESAHGKKDVVIIIPVCRAILLALSSYFILISEILFLLGQSSQILQGTETLWGTMSWVDKKWPLKIDLCNLLHKLCFYQGPICLSQFLSTLLQGFPGQISNTHTQKYNLILQSMTEGACIQLHYNG